MAENLLTGIQQIGIGVPDAEAAFSWYNKHLGLDVPVFDDVAKAELMIPHTNGVVRERRAILAVNMAGGGGAEIWESKNPLPLGAINPVNFGDLGIYAMRIKSTDVKALAETLGLKTYISPTGQPVAWLRDLNGNLVEIVPDDSWFKPNANHTGGVLGAVIGVSDIDRSLVLYKEVLGISDVVYDITATFGDFAALPGGGRRVRRVLLKKSAQKEGAFYKLFGNVEIELVQLIDEKPATIMEGRCWGDLGFIHLCFDTLDMEQFKVKAAQFGFTFTVDSGNTFNMGDAGGRFSYIVDPDGTLLEFVETHKVPIFKKLGLYINLKKRGMKRPLPVWMIKTLGWGRVKPNN